MNNSLALQDWANVATIAMAVFTFIALVGIGYQVRETHKMQKQAAARQLYGEFLKFVSADPESVSKEIIEPGSKYDWSMYLWLTALESGWLAFGGNTEWQRRIVSCVQQNREYFKSDYWLGRGTYEGRDASRDFNANFVNVVRIAIAEDDLRRKSSNVSKLAAE
jgi:hypothetical protein